MYKYLGKGITKSLESNKESFDFLKDSIFFGCGEYSILWRNKNNLSYCLGSFSANSKLLLEEPTEASALLKSKVMNATHYVLSRKGVDSIERFGLHFSRVSKLLGNLS